MSRTAARARRALVPLVTASVAFTLCAAPGAAGTTPAAEDYDVIELQARTNLPVNDDGWNLPPGSSFNSITPDLNDQGQIAFNALVAAEGDITDLAPGIWLGGGGEGEVVFRGENHQMISAVSLNESTDIAFPLSDGDVANRVFLYDAESGTASHVDTAPIVPNSYSSLGLDEDGNIGFQASQGSGRLLGAVRDGEGIFYLRDNTLDPDSDVGFIYTPAANDAGQIASKVGLTSDISNDVEVNLYEPDGTSRPILNTRTVSPGSPYSGFDNSVGLSDNGWVVAVATRAEDNTKVVVRVQDGPPEEVAEVGQDGLESLDFFAPDINNAGQAVFRGSDADGQAVFVADGESLQKVAGVGDVVETDLGTAQLGQHDNSPVFGGAPRINNRGDVSFTAGVHPEGDNQVEWGSGVFIAYADDTPPEPVHPETVERLGGPNRFATAANAALAVFPDGADTVYVTTGRDFPDALTASAPAGHAAAPVLLSDTTRVPLDTVAALEALDPEEIILVGGTTSVTDDVLEQLSAHGEVTRLGGLDRYETAAAVAATFGHSDTVYVATGEDYADALAAGARAGAEGHPVLLVQRDHVPAATNNLLAEWESSMIFIVGGEDSISEEVLIDLDEYAEVLRLSGADRYETAAAVSDHLESSEFSFLATGQDWPDALAGAALAAHLEAPIHLVQEGSVPRTTRDELLRLEPPHLRVVGGSDVVQDVVLDLLAELNYAE